MSEKTFAEYGRDSWELYFGEAGERTQMFRNLAIPDLTARQSLQRGDSAKLPFRIKVPGTSDLFVELMWVVVSDVYEDYYIGRLVNQPTYCEQSEEFYLRPGAEIPFLPEHIISIDYPPQGYDVEQLFQQEPTRRWSRSEDARSSKSTIPENSQSEIAKLSELAAAHMEINNHREAINFLQQLLPLVRASQNQQSEGTVMNLLGVSYYLSGDYLKAVEFHEQHLKISQEIQDQEGEKAALGNLGLAYDALGDDDKVAEYLQRYDNAG